MARLASDPVFAALTRPQMIGGVTYAFAVFNLVVTVVLTLVLRAVKAPAGVDQTASDDYYSETAEPAGRVPGSEGLPAPTPR